MDNRQLKTRSLTAAALGLVVVGLLLAGAHATMALVFLIGFMSAIEFYRITVDKSLSFHTLVFAAFTSIPLIMYLYTLLALQPASFVIPPNYHAMIVLSAPLLLALYFLVNIRSGIQMVTRRTRNYALALISVTVPCIFALILGLASSRMLLGIFVLIWVSDVGAFVIGSLWGRRKLAPTLSPGKTWEGTLAALVITLVSSALIAPFFFEASWQTGILIGALVVVFGTLGDLWQSMFKRLHDVKDSGTLLPGHGGFWDRFDSFLGCIPWIGMYYLLS